MTSYQGQAGDPADDPRRAPAKLGRYELLGHLATGGMAEIHLARLAGEAGFEKIVVVKRLLPELVASPTFVAMFLDEGKLVARLDHPNVCEVHELGRDGVEYFLAMPFLDGVPVSELIARPREADRINELRIATGVIAQACAGLHHAHELHGTDGASLGLVHRDVSPSNLFATSSGTVKVLDFGIAKVRGATETEAGTVKGKTQYMAPEQLLGEPLDRRCDVFALGIVLFELATHQRLFKRPSEFLAAKAILEEPIPRADAVDPAIPAGVADVIAKALARRREARYADAHELAAALVAAMAPHGGLAAPAEIAAAIVATDELTAQRTQKSRVLATARGATTVPAELATPLQRPPARRPDDDMTTQVAARRGTGRRWVVPAAIGSVLGASAIAFAIGRCGGVPVAAIGDARALGDARAIDAAPAAIAPRDAAVPAVDAVIAPDAPEPPPHARPRGQLNIDSTPYATIFVDGHSLGVTPLLRKTIAAGKHRVKAVLEDGRTRELVVDVPAGRAAPPIVLTW